MAIDKFNSLIVDNSKWLETEKSDYLPECHILNVGQLYSRGHGVKFYRDESTGLLKTLSGLRRVIYWINPRYRTTVNTGVASAINDILVRMSAISYGETHRKALMDFFQNSPLTRLKEKVYDRSKISERIITLLKDPHLLQMETIRSQKVSNNNLDFIFKYPRKLVELSNDQKHLKKLEFNYRLEEVKFAQSLGVEIIRNNNGSSGNYTGRDWKGKKLLIIKPSDEGPDSYSNPNWLSMMKNMFWKAIPFYGRRVCYLPNQNPIQESAASKMDRVFELGITPISHYVKRFKSKAFHGGNLNEEIVKPVSCTLFVDKAEEAYDKLELMKPTWWFPFQIPLVFQTYFMSDSKKADLEKKLSKDERFDLMVLAHLASGNGDGHPANYLISESKEATKNFLVAIDFGWSFPHSHPTDYLALRFMFDFRHLPHADRHFEDRTYAKIKFIKDNVENMLNRIGRHIKKNQPKNIDGITKENYKSVRPQGYEAQMLMCWQRLQPLFKAYDDHERLVELKKNLANNAAEISEIRSLEESLKICNIANVRSKTEFDQFFLKHGDKYPANPPFKFNFEKTEAASPAQEPVISAAS